MATKRPLGQINGQYPEVLLGDALLWGMTQNRSKEVDATNALSSKTLTARRTYLTGSANIAFTINLPAASAAIDGLIMTLLSTTTRILTTWSSSGATVPGIGNPTANVPISLQYNHATLVWYKVN